MARTSATTPVVGFGPAAFEFYAGLEIDNTKSYWEAHKVVYADAIKAPLLALLGELEPEFGTARVFRPHRDVRFSKDKSPYKEQQGAVTYVEDGVGYYLQVSADGLLIGGGWGITAPEQLTRFREAVAGPDGAELAKIVKALGKAGFAAEGEQLKTVPRGFASDHPRIDLLRHKSLYLVSMHEPAAWMQTPELVTKVRTSWRKCKPAIEWLAQHLAE